MNNYKTINQTIIYQGKLLSLIKERISFTSNEEFDRLTVIHPGAVVFIPQCEDGSLLLVRQYRHAAKKYFLEFPAGTLEEGENPLECARREIAEEVDHQAAEWIDLGAIYPSPGFCSEIIYCFVARQLSPYSAESDADEFLEVVRLSVNELEKLIKEGQITDSKTIALFTKSRLNGLL